MANKLIRLYYTIKDLRLIQIFFLIKYKLSKKKIINKFNNNYILSDNKFIYKYRRSLTFFSGEKIYFLPRSKKQ